MSSRDFCTLPHKSPNVHAVFERDPEILRTRLMCPCRAFYEWVVLFFSLENVGSLKTQISQKLQKPKHMAGNKIVKAAGAHSTRVQISGSNSQKRNGHLELCAVKCKNHALAS